LVPAGFQQSGGADLNRVVALDVLGDVGEPLDRLFGAQVGGAVKAGAHQPACGALGGRV
jgi:hypothetical protein